MTTVSPTSGYKVFVVEDSDPSRQLLMGFLARLPNCPYQPKPRLEILGFSTGEACVQQLHMKPDILILDYYLDESNPTAMNGLGLLKVARKVSPKTHVVVMSAQQNVMITAELFNNGIKSYISKEHACHIRVEKVVLDILGQIRKQDKSLAKHTLVAILFLAAGICAGWWFF